MWRARPFPAGNADLSRTIFITGVAGFIGSHAAHAFLERGWTVLGMDTEQGAPALVPLRLASLHRHPRFYYMKADLCELSALEALFSSFPAIDTILHLAARAGVRQSRLNPQAYIRDNISAQVSLLEACRALPRLRQILYASSSAVYGPAAPLPFAESTPVGGQASFYATTKRMNELTAQTYSHLYGFAQTGLRFFTVYGPLGRPDMACYGFARAIRDGRPLTLWEGDDLARDFTYIEDVVAALLQLALSPAEAGSHRVLNVGCGNPRPVMTLVRLLEETIGRPAHIRRAVRPVEDMARTWADISALQEAIPWRARIPLEEGVARFARWFAVFSPI